ncbi:alpha/beta hydrolase [Photobacterium sp. SDRW27]|uniref:alpha/beta hydrolase n=1 Tax=Photobacterium obscurum TaxID=2829490 RepID=UPI0022433020|nr:alpha/beta hydrolase [Photobacterium obscurum]MCW8328014.1 alpha/beta hydrolase [Photobacterium obscurum]
MYKLASGLLTCLVLAGCNSGGSDDKFSKIDVTTAQSCPSNMTCGFMSAPKSYEDGSSEMVEIYYGVHKALDPANRIGALILNFGGPSAEAVLGASSMASYALPKEILNRFDIVGIDPRGTGQSAFAKELTECAVAEYRGEGDCNSTYQQVAPYLGSNTVVKDIDRLRELLGDDKLTFLGYSYGTRLGSLYAKTFPDNVRAIVLDSPMSPTNANNVEIRVGNTAGYEKIADFRLGHDISRNNRYQDIVDSLFTGPDYSYRANDDTLSLKDGISTLNLTVAREPSGDWQDIESGLVKLLDEDSVSALNWSLLLKSGGTGSVSDSELYDQLRGNALFKAVVCTDERAPLTDSEIEATESRYTQASSLYGLLTYHQTAELCKGWSAQRDPIPAVTDMEAALGGQQILIIGGQYDPATPYVWAEEMAANFGASASLVTVDNYVDHGFSYSGIGCIDKNTTAYLLDPDYKIAEQTCNAPVSTFGKSFAIAPGVPHPAKDVIGW